MKKMMIGLVAVALSCATIMADDILDFLPSGGQEPVITEKVKAEYPEDAVKSRVEGVVYVRVALDKDGNIMSEKVEVIKNSSKNESLANAAIDAVKHYKFSPAMVDNKPVKLWYTIPVKFQLDDKHNASTTK
ncbi:MAG: energy transducer TonB [Candidatus Delongbacteria bacterium]|nr:energy transducer TonB [Candidatus Delongbacteria bacterium]